jgi:hypothetical protein
MMECFRETARQSQSPNIPGGVFFTAMRLSEFICDILQVMRTPRRILAIIAVFVVSFLILCGYAGYKFDHIRFLYLAPKLGNQSAVPMTPMPASQVPDNWKKCRLGAVKFSAPPEYLKNRRVIGPFMALSGSNASIFISGATDATAMIDANRSHFPVWFARAGDNPIRLRAIAFQASRSQFRWGMSRSELHDLNNILGYKFLGCGLSVIAGEEME